MLTSENRTRDAHEPTGEPESLWGKMRGRMGDRVQYGRPNEEAEAEKKKKKEAAAAKKKRQQVGTIIHAAGCHVQVDAVVATQRNAPECRMAMSLGCQPNVARVQVCICISITTTFAGCVARP